MCTYVFSHTSTDFERFPLKSFSMRAPVCLMSTRLLPFVLLIQLEMSALRRICSPLIKRLRLVNARFCMSVFHRKERLRACSRTCSNLLIQYSEYQKRVFPTRYRILRRFSCLKKHGGSELNLFRPTKV